MQQLLKEMKKVKAIRLGFQKKDGDKWYGIGLNESATEYYAQKLYSKTGHKKVYTGYETGVYVIKDLIELYGETTILDAMLNGTEKFEQLIAKGWQKLFTNKKFNG